MSDYQENDSGAENGENPLNPLTQMLDLAEGAITGVPAPIRRNLLKALGRLTTALVDYPVAVLEGKVAEKKAETKNRIAVLNAAGKQIAKGVDVSDEYIDAASRKFAEKIVREQKNMDSVAKVAIEQLQGANEITDLGNLEPAVISDDWLNAFEKEAVAMSSEQMQNFFGKILAGEIRRPSSYSIKTVRLLAQLDNAAAQLFKTFCSLVCGLGNPQEDVFFNARVISFGDAAQNSLAPYGLHYGALNILEEYGLITSDYNSYANYIFSVPGSGGPDLPLFYNKKFWWLEPSNPESNFTEMNLNGVALTFAGHQLFSIVDTDSVEGYTTALVNLLSQRGVRMIETEPIHIRRVED